MTNSSTSSPQRSAAAVSLRKTNKPLMEKRRRARINDSLTQLKSLVIQSSKKDSSQFNKLEKADILELTVKHLRNLQTREQQQQLAQVSNAETTGKYCAGFMECANEVLHFLKQSQDFSDDTKARVMGHLANCLQFTNQPFAAKTTPAAVQQMSTANRSILANASVVGSAQQSAVAQLGNNQIIHIVNAPFHPTKPAVGQFTATATPVHISSSPAMKSSAPVPQQYLTPQQQQLQQTVPLLSVVSPNVPPTSSNLHAPTLLQDKSYTRFSQPLHIQIPASNVSPYVLKAENRQPMPRIEDMPTTNFVPTSAPSVSPAETVSSNPSLSSPSPVPAELPQMKTKHVHFNPADLPVHGDSCHSRHRSYSMTSSSSESEMSPLNLSQSPDSSSCSSSQDNLKVSTYSNKQPTHYDYLSMKYKMNRVSPSSYVYHNRDFKENVELAQSNNFTSVIVNTKRPLDMGMDLDEDRLCPRQHGTPSPASSMGEERPWRPW